MSLLLIGGPSVAARWLETTSSTTSRPSNTLHLQPCLLPCRHTNLPRWNTPLNQHWHQSHRAPRVTNVFISWTWWCLYLLLSQGNIFFCLSSIRTVRACWRDQCDCITNKSGLPHHCGGWSPTSSPAHTKAGRTQEEKGEHYCICNYVNTYRYSDGSHACVYFNSRTAEWRPHVVVQPSGGGGPSLTNQQSVSSTGGPNTMHL